MIALGANVGDAATTIAQAWQQVVAQLPLNTPSLSSIVISEPAEGATGPQFFNAVGCGWSSTALHLGHVRLQRIEAAFGRDRNKEGWHGPRPLDLDVIAVDDIVSDDPVLTLPHPRMHARWFVLAPLAQIWPDFVDPRTRAPIAQLIQRIALVVGVAVSASCRHQPEPPQAISAPGQPPPPFLLAEVPLAHTAAVDQIAQAWQLVGADSDGLEFLAQTAPHFTPEHLAADTGARRWVMWTVFKQVQAKQLGDKFEQIRRLVDTLQLAAPNAPEAKFCRALLRLVLLERADGQLQENGIGRAIIQDLHDDLLALVALKTWNGPAEYDAARIEDEWKRVAKLLRGLPQPQSVTPVDAASEDSPSQTP